jgi:hypothetical protein
VVPKDKEKRRKPVIVEGERYHKTREKEETGHRRRGKIPQDKGKGGNRSS